MYTGVVDLHVAQSVGGEVAVLTDIFLDNDVGLHVTLEVTLLRRLIGASGG